MEVFDDMAHDSAAGRQKDAAEILAIP